MANKIIWDSNPSASTLLSTTLNSLADGNWEVSGELDNSTNLDMLIDFELVLAAQGSARDSGAYCPMYMISSIDGTNYEYNPDDTGNPDPPADSFVGTFTFDAATTARRAMVKQIPFPPGKHKICLENNTGQAFASSGNTLKYRVYSPEVQ